MESRYSNGYVPKINYWSQRVLEATNSVDKERAMASLRYFMARQMELESSKMK
tara:strand:+ start:396 stop:554 length:159 start_codon:yes stop_codon:yes gene_type:complete